jgi:phospholipid transport system substrate-binding protein
MLIFFRPSLLAFSLAGLLIPALAAPSSCFAAETVSAHEEELQAPAAKFIQDLGDRAIKIISNKQLSLDQRNTEFSKVLSDSFDLKTIGRFVIGRAWNTANPGQQNDYMALFKALVIKNYGDRMTLASGETFLVVGVRPESDVDTTVLSQITHSDNSKPTLVDWRVRQKDNKISVIDIIVAGVSLSVTQRQEYASVIQNSGGQIDGLLETMRNQLKGQPHSSSATP